MNEKQFERRLKDKIKKRFPGCHIAKNDAAEYQGIPDILILWRNTWAMLEIKIDPSADHQPNQDYYVEKFGSMSFASFINPHNEEEVLDALQQAFGSVGQTCIS